MSPSTISFRDVSYCSNIISILPEVYNNATHCDVTFFCRNGKVVKAHRLLLGSVSIFLNRLFLEQANRDSVEVSLPDIDSADLDNVLRFIYEGLVRLDEGEHVIFHEIIELLGLNVPSVGEEAEDVQPAQQNRKRKRETSMEEVPRKFPRDVHSQRQNVIYTINTMIENLSVTPERKRKNNAASKPEQNGPLLVPIKHLKTVLSILEGRKAEKKLEFIVERVVQQYIKKIQESLMKSGQKTNLNHKLGDAESHQMPHPVSESVTYI